MWPKGKRFAFTVVDDTDAATLSTVKPIYDFLEASGFLTTKTVWPLRSAQGTPLEGDTLQDELYRAWVLELQSKGFEIAYHGAAAEPSTRERSIEALSYFAEVMDHPPRLYASHSGQNEAMYWGAIRLSGAAQKLFAMANRLLDRRIAFDGDVESSPYFWGDLCREQIEYTRNFTFNDINTLACDPNMPYREHAKPFVRYWFSASNAPQLDSFCELLSEANQERLEGEGGACIVYTHFAYKFVRDEVLDSNFVRLMTALSRRNGWFVPASTILDHLKEQPGWTGEPTALALQKLQLRWFVDNLRTNRGRKYLRRLRKRLLRI